jgi:hypothetical protein
MKMVGRTKVVEGHRHVGILVFVLPPGINMPTTLAVIQSREPLRSKALAVRPSCSTLAVSYPLLTYQGIRYGIVASQVSAAHRQPL